MLHGTALTLGLVAVAKLLDEGVRLLLHRLRHPSAEVARSAPWVQRLGRSYGAPVRLAWTLVLLATCAVLVADIWGYGTLAWFHSGQPGHRVLTSLLSIAFTTVLGLVVWEIANTAIERHLARQISPDSKAATSTRMRTLLPVLRAFIAVGVCAFILFDILQQLGVNIGPLVAGAGVVGLALGVGSQKLVQDVITGIFLLFEDSVAIGDIVQLGGLSGKVEHLTIRSIKLRANDGSVHWVPFSAVSTVTNMTRDFGFAVVDVTVDWSADPDHVTRVLHKLGAEMCADEDWQDMMLAEPEVVGMEKLTDQGLVFRLRLKTPPAARWSVTRELNRRIRLHFGRAGIEAPMAPPARPAELAPLPMRVGAD
jgi:small-conductance mechanosensitive channel